MIGMQYKVSLPEDFDMNIIRERVKNNGHKTDGFKDLLFKVYLISEEAGKEYAPLYVWKDSEGMNEFIFDGFYDNILGSFGWQTINIGVPLLLDLGENFSHSRYVLELENEITPVTHMTRPQFSHTASDSTGMLLIYNPDKWRYTEFYFYQEVPKFVEGKLYQLLHLSQ